jgi:hypothetical protein
MVHGGGVTLTMAASGGKTFHDEAFNRHDDMARIVYGPDIPG